MSDVADETGATASQPETHSPTAASPVRPFYWSVRREIWENRSIYIGPLIAAAVVLFGFTLGNAVLARHLHELGGQSQEQRKALLWAPYAFACGAVVVTAFIVAAVYCLGALQGERRDRSILFWKSLPVSDLTTVLAKVTVPMVVVPIVAIAIALALEAVMLLLGTTVLLLHGMSAGPLWSVVLSHLSTGVLIWGVIALTLWYAPIWAWLLLVSGWARRVAFLWVVLPPLALCLVEKIAFDSGYLASAIGYRLTGAAGAAFVSRGGGIESDMTPDPIGFLTTPGLWGGLIVAAAFVAAAVLQRRYRGPL